MAFQYFLYFLLISGLTNTKLFVHSLSQSAYEKIVEEAKAFPITLDKEHIADDDLPKKPKMRGGATNPKLRWHDYKMLIVIDSAYTKEERAKMTAAVYTLGRAMECFKFILVNKDHRVSLSKDHLYIKKGEPGDCFSNLGRLGIGRQVAEIGERCNLFGTVMHEIMHVLGFYHEHVRQDRNGFVEVHEDQFKPPTPGWMRSQYAIRYDQIMYVSEYDFDSVMHYQMPNQFMKSIPGKMPPDARPGQRDHLSKLDVQRLKAMYPCANAPGS